MVITRQFRTNLRCNSCVAAVKPHLDREVSITRWEVDVAVPDKVLTVEGEDVSAEAVKAAVARAGFQVLSEVSFPREKHPTPQPGRTSTVATYHPLLLLVAFLVGVIALIELRAGTFVWTRAMESFMGAFFLAFSFFKLLDLRGFADSFRMYDVVARRVPAYAYAYPFIELLLGAAYVTGFQPLTTNLVTLLVMSAGSVGVIQSLVSRQKIRCACLGTVFNLPMSTVTLVEDGLMVAMAAAALLGGGH